MLNRGSDHKTMKTAKQLARMHLSRCRNQVPCYLETTEQEDGRSKLPEEFKLDGAAGEKELGLIRERKVSTSSTERNKTKHPCQRFAYLVIIDFESTCWERDKTKTQEIIEFPAVLLNTNTGQIEDEFHFYVQPQENPTLSSFCRELTGISQDQVDNGIPLSLCLRKFSHWLHKLSQEKQIYLLGDKGANSGQTVVNHAAIVTWSDWDLGVCLHYELRRKQIPKSPCFNQWIDLRATYTKFYDRKPKGLNGALQDVGIKFEGREHSGLHDSRNTAALAWRMMRDNCVMNITKSLVPVSSHLAGSPKAQKKAKILAQNPKTSLPGESSKVNCQGDSTLNDEEGKKSRTNMCHAGLRMRNPNIPQVLVKDNGTAKCNGFSCKRQASLTPERSCKTKCSRQSTPEKSMYRHLQSRNQTSPKIKLLASSCTISLVCQPQQTEIQSKTNCGRTDSTAKLTPTSHIASATFVQALSACHSKMTHKTSENSPISVGTAMVRPSSSLFGPSVCSASSNTPQHNTRSAVAARFTSSKDAPMVKSAFRVPQVTGRTPNSCSSFRVPQNTPKCSPKVEFKTPQNLCLPSNTMKATPPLCMCGRRAKRRLVQNPGPNSGRWFFSCTKGNANSASSKASGCGFFKWETVSSIVSPVSVTLVNKHVYPGGISDAASARPFTRVLQVADSLSGQKRLSFSKTL